jgi:thiamine biosynthesis lipoprotein
MSTGNVSSATFGVFGTTAVLVVTSHEAMAPARAIADEVLGQVDLACSRFRPDSELSRLNSSGGAPMAVSPTFADLLAAALRAAELTDGAVDPTCGAALVALGYDRDFADLPGAGTVQPETASGAGQPASAGQAKGGSGGVQSESGFAAGQPLGGPTPVPGWRCVHLDQASGRVWLDGGAQLDLGATAKAWAADQSASQIAARLGCGVLVSLGGDVATAGEPPSGQWRIRVTDDHGAPESAPGQTVAIASGGLATSSTTVRAWASGGRRVHHILDPATGQPAPACWRTVTVTAGTCTDANTASTAAIVRGAAAPDWLSGLGLPARLVRPDGTVVTTPGWPAGDELGAGQ